MNVISHRLWLAGNVAVAFTLVAAMNQFSADAAGTQMKIAVQLSGSEQVPAVQTNGTGQFQGTVAGSKSISYRLTFSGLSSRVTAAHIHLAKRGTNGGVIAFLCGGGGKPSCPASDGTISGTITGANVLATTGLKRGDLPAMIQAIMSGGTYVNVHTTKYKDGEIRGQIEPSR